MIIASKSTHWSNGAIVEDTLWVWWTWKCRKLLADSWISERERRSSSISFSSVQFSFSRWMSVVGHRPSPLTSAGPRFAQHDGSVLRNYLNRYSISSLVFLGSLCVHSAFPGAGCPTVVCSSSHMTSLIPFEFANRFHDISYFGFGSIELFYGFAMWYLLSFFHGISV